MTVSVLVSQSGFAAIEICISKLDMIIIIILIFFANNCNTPIGLMWGAWPVEATKKKKAFRPHLEYTKSIYFIDLLKKHYIAYIIYIYTYTYV